jgi:fibronectin-binding autotransporter adhesin
VLTIDGRKAKITVSGNDAVGVFRVNSGAQLTLARLTVADGRGLGGSTGGGIFNNGGTLEVTDSTLSGNSAQSGGGGVWNRGTATLKNTILANGPSGGNCFGVITDGGYNIDDGTSCGFSEANNSLPSTNPLLNPKSLQNNDGPTKTIQLSKGSPAISVIPEGENGCGDEIAEDQRGVKRPQRPGCDIGAFEKKRHVQPNQQEEPE